MRWSPDGSHLLGGIGTLGAYLDGVLIVPQAGGNSGWDWVDAGVVMGPGGYDGPSPGLYAWRLPSGPAQWVNALAATDFYGNGLGSWVRYLADGFTGSSDSAGHAWPDRVALGFDGLYEIFTDLTWIPLIFRDITTGAEVTVPAPGEWTALPDGSGYFSRTDRGAMWGGEWYAAGYRAEFGGLCVWRPFNAGAPVWRLSTTPDDFNPDLARREADGRLVLGTGINSGETGQHVYELDPTALSWRKDGGAWQPLTPAGPTPPEPEPPTPVVIAPFQHYAYEGPFFATGQYGNVDHPGNCEVLVRATFDQMVRARDVFCEDVNAGSVPTEFLKGIYFGFEGGQINLAIVLARVLRTEGLAAVTVPRLLRLSDAERAELLAWTVTALARRIRTPRPPAFVMNPASSSAPYDAALACARSRGVPLLVYYDANEYPDWVCDDFVNEPNIIPCVQAYPAAKNSGEPLKATPAEDVARIRSTVEHLRQRYARVAIARTMYTQTANYPLQHILDMQPGLTDLVRDFAVYADLWFAWLRDPANAIAGNPQLQEWCKALPAACVGAPPPVLEPVPPEPEPPEPEPPQPEPPEPEPPRPDPPEPEPPQPEPEPEVPPMTIGQKGQFRPFGSKAAWTKGIVCWHQDEKLYEGKPTIFSVSTDLTVDPTNTAPGHICAWIGGGKFEDNRASAGGAERTSFDGRNLFVGRPDEFADVFEWVNLS